MSDKRIYELEQAINKQEERIIVLESLLTLYHLERETLNAISEVKGDVTRSGTERYITYSHGLLETKRQIDHFSKLLPRNI